MTYKIITTQNAIYGSFLQTGLIARGIAKKIIDIKLYNLHDFAFDKHKSVDDEPYGGGAGMILRVDVMENAVSSISSKRGSAASGKNKESRIILLTPQGKRFTQKGARRLAKEKEIILISGRFEGFDERIRNLVDEEISIGDYVLTSGDLPAMVLIDAISRQIPHFIEKSQSIQEESFSESKLEIDNCKLKNCLEYPQYTRPMDFNGNKVPKILISGNHGKISKWRKEQSIKRTTQQINNR